MTLKKITALFACACSLFCVQACLHKQTTVEQTGTPPEVKVDTNKEVLPAGGAVPAGEAKIFRGLLGEQHKIEMRLTRDGERLSGTYVYAKVGTNLNLNGTIDKQGNLTLRESDESGKQTGVFKGKWSEPDSGPGIVIEGDWSRPNSEKQQHFYLVEQHIELANGLSLVTKQIKENNKQAKYTIAAEYPQIEGSTDANIQKFNREVSALVNKEVGEWKKNAGQQSDSEEDLAPDALGDDLEIGYDTELANNDFASVLFSFYIYEHGAAHGSSYSHVVNYDLKSGKSLTLADLFQPHADYLQVISAYCIKDLKRQAGKVKPDERLLNDSDIEEGAAAKAENYQSWNLTKKGLLITFDAYQVGPYAAGSQEVVVPYSALSGILNPNGPLIRLVK